MNRRHLSRLVPALLIALALWPVAHAQTFPNKPIRIVVPFGAGGVADLTARTVAGRLAEQLGQSVVIENKPGAGGVVAAETVLKSEPDGHTLLLMSNGTAVSAGLFKSLPFDTLKDFAPISTLGTFDIAIVVPVDSRFKTLGELLAHARSNPGKLNVGSINIGSTQNLAAELFKSTAAMDAQIVPFNGTPPVITALRGGSLDAMLDILGPVMPQIKSNALRPLAMLSEKRALNLPDVPTVQESGGVLAKFHAGSWNGLAVPAKTPRDVVLRLSREIQAVMEMPEVKKRLSEVNLYAQGSTPEQATDILAQDVRRWGEVITKAKIDKQ
jgi:tripartite-type tricarboxylate transporter receptor subunit TctC